MHFLPFKKDFRNTFWASNSGVNFHESVASSISKLAKSRVKRADWIFSGLSLVFEWNHFVDRTRHLEENQPSTASNHLTLPINIATHLYSWYLPWWWRCVFGSYLGSDLKMFLANEKIVLEHFRSWPNKVVTVSNCGYMSSLRWVMAKSFSIGFSCISTFVSSASQDHKILTIIRAN